MQPQSQPQPQPESESESESPSGQQADSGSFLNSYLPYLLQRADRLLSVRLHQELQKAGVQVSEWQVLAVLSDHGPLSVTELAGIALLPQPTASHTCRRLEAAGLLVRQESEQDRRRKIHQLTEEGQELVIGFMEIAKGFEAEQLAELKLERAELIQMLEHIMEQLAET